MLFHLNISNSVFVSCSPLLKTIEDHSSLLSQGHSNKLAKAARAIKSVQIKTVQTTTVHTHYSSHLDKGEKKQSQIVLKERNSGLKAHCMLFCIIINNRTAELGRWHTLCPL